MSVDTTYEVLSNYGELRLLVELTSPEEPEWRYTRMVG